MLSCFRHRGMYVYINLYHATHLASTMVFIPIFSKCWYALGSGLVFVMYILLNDRTWNRPLLWLLSRHLSLAQQYLGRVNREVAFRSQWVRSPGLSALRWAGALSRIRNVCLSWLSRRPTSIKTHWNFPCSSRQFQLCGLHQKNRDISTKLIGNLTIRSFSNYSPSTTWGPA